MISLLKNFIYLIWTFINILQDTCFKYNNIPISLIFLIRYPLIIIVLAIINLFIKKDFHNAHLKEVFVINFFKSICTFLGMLLLALQIKSTNVFNTSLVFYNIPLLDFFFHQIFRFKTENTKYLWLVNSINGSIIWYYFLFNCSYVEYIYGCGAAILFSLSNILIIKGKAYWKNSNPYFMSQDIQIFSAFMFIYAIFYAYFSGIPSFHIPMNTVNYISITIISICGFLLQLLLYYFFSRLNYTPSSFITCSDLLVALLVDVFVGHVFPSTVKLLLLISMISAPYFYKKLKI